RNGGAATGERRPWGMMPGTGPPAGTRSATGRLTMTPRTTTVAAVAAAAVLIAGCNAGAGDGDGGDGTGTAAPGGDRRVTVGVVAEPASLDFTTTDGAAIPQALLYNVYGTLVKSEQDGELVAALASEWEVSDDGLSYTFTLQE